MSASSPFQDLSFTNMKHAFFFLFFISSPPSTNAYLICYYFLNYFTDILKFPSVVGIPSKQIKKSVRTTGSVSSFSMKLCLLSHFLEQLCFICNNSSTFDCDQVLTHRLGSASMLSLIYSEILKMLRLWGLLNFDVEIFFPHDSNSSPRGYLKQKSVESDQPHIMTTESLLVKVSSFLCYLHGLHPLYLLKKLPSSFNLYSLAPF